MQFILKRLGTKLKKLRPRPVKNGFRYAEVGSEFKFYEL